MKLPGKAKDSGFWAATWIMGNLGRAGYYPSLEGIWPFSYDACTDGSQGHEWNSYKTQRINRCNGVKGESRGVGWMQALIRHAMHAQSSGSRQSSALDSRVMMDTCEVYTSYADMAARPSKQCASQSWMLLWSQLLQQFWASLSQNTCQKDLNMNRVAE